MRRGRFRWQRFWWALGLSLVVHVRFVLPELIEPLTALSQPRDQVEEIALLPDDPATLEPVPEQPPTPPDPIKPPDEQAQKKKKEEEKKLAKAPEPVVAPTPKPEPPRPVVKAEPVPPPPPQPLIDKRKQMVSQDQFKEEQDNTDARYLAEKNHRTQEDKRTESTNLIRQATGAEHLSAPNDNKDKQVGEKDQKIAELEAHKGSDLAREAPQRGNEGQAADKRPSPPGPLAMRNLVPRADDHAAVKQRDGVERQEHAAGELPMQRQGVEGQRAAASKKGGAAVNLTLDHRAYDNIEGFATAERERHEAARAERSHVRGRYDRYLDKVGALRSALENFTPDVKVGNQAELGTRASPFAAYITSMHRQIHKIFTFGFLADQDGRFGGGAFEDETLWTQVQISLNGDGTLDKLGITRSSGNVAFDAVAVDSVRSAAPFERPPSAVRSANGKVYMDWQFHRDERACGTFGVDPHILTTPGDNVEHDTSETGGPHHAAAAGTGAAAVSGPGSGSGTEEEGPRRLQRAPTTAAEHAAPSTPAVVPEITSDVHVTAEGWFAAWTRGDISWLAGWSQVPFLAGGHIAASSPTALKAMYKQMVAESAARKVIGIELFTPGGVRAKTGGLPPGGEESGMLFATADSGGERFVLLLKQTAQGWRVAGLVR